MPSCSNGHTVDGDVKFCPTCGSPVSSGGAATPPASGFRSTMKSMPSSVGNSGREFSSSTGYTPPVSAPTAYMPPATPAPMFATPVYTGPMYVAPGAGVSDHRDSAKGLGIAGMVLGIVSLVFFFAWFIGIICSIVGLVLSSVAWRKISTGSARPDGKGFAIAGFVTSIIAVAFYIILIFAVMSILSTNTY